MKKKFFSSFLIVLLLLVNFGTSTFAVQEPLVDFTKKGSITVHKYSFEGVEADKLDGTGLELGENVDILNQSTPLPGTKYKIQQTHELVQGTNNQEELVELTTPADPTEITTDANGEASLNNLDLGRYTLKEISAPGHLIDTATYYIDVPLTVADGTQLLYDVHVYPKNTPVQGSVEFKNIGEDDEANALPDVTFHLFNGDGTRVDDVDYVSKSDGKVKVEGLAPGSYYFQEVETVDGYLLNNTKIKFEIKEVTGDEQPKTVELDDFPNYKEPGVFEEQRGKNETEWGEKTIASVGETVEFRLSAKAPTDIKEYKKFALSNQIDPRLNYDPDTTPKVYINDLDTPLVLGDDYTLTKPTEGNNNTLEVSLTETGIAKLNAGDTLYVEFSAVVNESAQGEGPIENSAIVDWDNDKGGAGGKESAPTITTPEEGTLTITKVAKNDNDKLLAGATFKLQRQNENGDWVDVADSTQTTGSTGVLTWDRLVPGDYRLVETVAPDGYNLLANPIEFTIDDTNLTPELLVENMPVGLIPQTGGMGTLLFTVSGLLLMSFAGFNLMRKRQEA